MIVAQPKGTGPEYNRHVQFVTGVNLPKLIDGPGTYLLRNGMMAIVHEITDPRKSTFYCKGHIQRVLPSGRVRQDFNIWQPNGRFVALGEHPHDIIKKVATE